jgi:hypothetical protein
MRCRTHFKEMNLRKYTLIALLAALTVGGQPAWAQSASYHLERLQIQARDFLQTLQPAAAAEPLTSASVDQQLQQSNSNSVWSRQMVSDDVDKIIETSAQLSEQLRETDPDELLAARATVESLARRLRVSTSALNLSPASRTSLDFLMLELEESGKVMAVEREQLLAQEKQQRRSYSVGLGFGLGYGGWGVPCGWGSYYPYGYGWGGYPSYAGYGRVYGVSPRGCR